MRCITAIWPAGPPKESAATRAQTRRAAANGAAAIVHEADLEDERYDAPEAAGFDLILRALSVAHEDDEVLTLTRPIFDAVYEFMRRSLLTGRDSL